LWDLGLLLNAMERYEEARKNFGNALEDFGMLLRSMGNLELTYSARRLWRVHDGRLKEMVDLFIEDRGGFAPLAWAAGDGYEAVVRLLLDGGAAIEARDWDGRTPLLWAAVNGHKAVVRLLLDRDAAIEAKDHYDRTPLSWAAEDRHEAVVRLLLDGGAAI